MEAGHFPRTAGHPCRRGLTKRASLASGRLCAFWPRAATHIGRPRSASFRSHRHGVGSALARASPSVLLVPLLCTFSSHWAYQHSSFRIPRIAAGGTHRLVSCALSAGRCGPTAISLAALAGLARHVLTRRNPVSFASPRCLHDEAGNPSSSSLLCVGTPQGAAYSLWNAVSTCSGLHLHCVRRNPFSSASPTEAIGCKRRWDDSLQTHRPQHRHRNAVVHGGTRPRPMASPGSPASQRASEGTKAHVAQNMVDDARDSRTVTHRRRAPEGRAS